LPPEYGPPRLNYLAVSSYGQDERGLAISWQGTLALGSQPKPDTDIAARAEDERHQPVHIGSPLHATDADRIRRRPMKLAQRLVVSFQEVVHSALAVNADVAKQKRFAEDRMDTHKNACLTPKGREEMVRAVVEGGLSKAAAARRYNTTPKTVAKWVNRFRAEGIDGLRDRSSRPLSLPSQTPQATCTAVEALRRQRYTGKQIAAEVGISGATVSRILRRLGLNRLSALEPAEPVRRYERERPGEMIHIDIKKLGKFNQIGHRITGDRRGQSNRRGVGWEFVHVAIDDHSRIAFAKVMPSEKRRSALTFLKAALAYYESLGVKVERVMTDNGSCYKSFAFRTVCKQLRLRHIRTKPYTPRTNGKAERFIQTSLREWAYAQAYQNSRERKAELPSWLHRYNWHRPHAGIDGKTPISRLGLTENNVLRLHS
jgi:transposase InsO family protein